MTHSTLSSAAVNPSPLIYTINSQYNYMSTVKIDTLSAIHVGSGQFLQNNADFLVRDEKGDSYIYVIDPEKILKLIGTNHVSNWVSAIERGESTQKIVQTYCPQATPAMYARRSILNYAHCRANDTLKETIHNGMGVPYIPGSSIKGAIRTAVISSAVERIPNLERMAVRQNRSSGKTIVSAQQVEKAVAGSEPQYDIFRFLRVGDAYFSKGCEISCRVVNLNIRQGSQLLDESKPQLVEAIGLGSTSQFSLALNTEVHKWAKSKDSNIMSLPEEMRSVETLFSTINHHTAKLLQDEIDFWKSVSKYKDGAGDYIDNIRDILQESQKCLEGKECILRLGHASGWRFITGAWSEGLACFKEKIVPIARPKNFRYQEYDFPKSRRIDEDGGYVFGFVKLTLQ